MSANLPSLGDIFSPGGILEQRLPHYEFRASQHFMAESVLAAIRDRQTLCVEAGTGTGKTLAYLIPALLTRQRVIVSTATKNLQDQLFFKDIPFLREHLFPGLSATYMKGRNNYLCLKKLHDQSPQGHLLSEAKEDWGALWDWIQVTETGDRAELDWVADHDPLWRDLDARSETCIGQKCSLFDSCYITRMRQRSLEADLIVVNHALFFANLALEVDEIGRVLPSFSVLILDEAHEVEEIAANYFGSQVSSHQLEDLCGDLFRAFRSDRDLGGQITQLQAASSGFFASFPDRPGKHSINFFQQSGGTEDLRLSRDQQFRRLESCLDSLYHSVEQLSPRPPEADSLVRRLGQTHSTLQEIFEPGDSEKVYWFERRGRGVFLHVNPIDVATILQERLFSRTDATVLTSATLAANNSFDYFKDRLGIGDSMEVIAPSEFNYSEQAVLYVPASFPEPRSALYLERSVKEMEDILEITQGHAFLLFTSLAQMDRVHGMLAGLIPFPLLRQGDRPRNQLLEMFRETPQAVLCATSSFWQGVDVRGDALRAVIIDKLPFAVPTEPLVAARMNWLQQKGNNPFLSYSVPEAIISLRQGLGRLIRSRQDTGILAIFDSRLRTRSYGRLFLQSLPNCPVVDNIEKLRHFYGRTASDTTDTNND